MGLIFINILVIELLQGILEKEELFRESALAGQKKESRQSIFEGRSRKVSTTFGEMDIFSICKKKRSVRNSNA